MVNMIDVLIVTVVFGAALLSFFSGFGFGTVLMPVVALFFPLQEAVALTAMAHLLQNVFKILFLFPKIRWEMVAKFGIPAFFATVPGAWMLTKLEMMTLHRVVGSLLIFFAFVEWMGMLKRVSNPIFGGILSGFFGGLSGHQGAFRSAFLLHMGLKKEEFIATGGAISLIVDITRLMIYGVSITLISPFLSLSVVLAAFFGAILGKTLLSWVSYRWIHDLVALLLLIFGIFIFFGLIGI